MNHASSGTAPAGPRFRQHAPFLAVLAIAALIYIPATWSDVLASLGGDSATYVLTARHYAPYVPGDPVTAHVAANSQFPPLYSLLLAASGGAADLHWAHFATTLCLLGALAVLYAWVLSLGLSRAAAAAIAALFAALQGTWLQALYLLSESLYLMLALASLVVIDRAARTGRSHLYWAAAGLVAAALLARSAGVALLPALALVLWRERPARWIFMIPAAIAPAVAWAIFHRPEASYTTGFLEHAAAEMTSLEGLLWRLSYDAQAIGLGFVRNFIATAALFWVVTPLAALALLVAVLRFFRGAADAWYALAYLAVIIVWPYPAEALRFAWLLTPFALAYLALGGAQLAARLPGLSTGARRAVAWTAIAIVGLVVLPGFAVTLRQFVAAAAHPNPQVRHLAEWYAYDRDAAWSADIHFQIARAIREVSSHAPPGACVLAIKPQVVAFFGERRAFNPPFADADSSTFDAQLARRGCEYLVLLPFDSPSFPGPFYPADRMEGRLETVAASVLGESGERLAILARIRR